MTQLRQSLTNLLNQCRQARRVGSKAHAKRERVVFAHESRDNLLQLHVQGCCACELTNLPGRQIQRARETKVPLLALT